MGLISQKYLEENARILLILSIIWILLTVIRNNKDDNTKKLKAILIGIWGYIISLFIIKPTLNLNHIEFFIGYLTSYQLLKISSDIPSLEKKIKVWIWTIMILFLSSIHFFMIFRTAVNVQNFFENEEFKIYSNSQKNEWYLKLKNKQINKKIQLPLKSPLVLNKNNLYTLEYQSTEFNWEDSLILTTPIWTLLKIYPQSQVILTIENNSLNYKKIRGKIIEIQKNERKQDSELLNFFNNYDKKLQNFILQQLPINYQKNWKLQKYAYEFTVFLWSYIPFYQKNKEYANTFKAYLLDYKEIKKENKEYNRENSYINWEIWLWKTSSIKNWKMLINKYFLTLF